MEAWVNRVTGIDDAITSMFFSKRTWTREKENEIRRICDNVLSGDGSLRPMSCTPSNQERKQFKAWMDSLIKFGTKHITMLRFIDVSVTVRGMHRGGQDDWDAHAMRYNNRIIRNSTRIKGSEFGYELSDFYKDKILPTDIALKALGVELPAEITHDGETYIKRTNGYIRKGYEDNNDVKRGLYMLSIPSDFIFKVNLTEWAHVYKERNKNGTANPEVKELCESIADQLEEFHPQFNRELWLKILN